MQNIQKYKIIRYFFNAPNRNITIKNNLTLKEAQEHCKNPETSSRSCKNNPYNHNIPWFDGYTEE